MCLGTTVSLAADLGLDYFDLRDLLREVPLLLLRTADEAMLFKQDRGLSLVAGDLALRLRDFDA
jgi:hypothetical protein